MSLTRTRRVFTEAEIAKAKRDRATGTTWKALGLRLGCNGGTIRRVMDPEWAQRQQQAVLKWQRENQSSTTGGNGRHVRATTVPDATLADRDAREAAPRTLTQQFCGDPPPGYSALDKKRGGVAP